MTSIPNYPGAALPAGTGGPVPRMVPPSDVRTSVTLWFASIAAGLLGSVLVFALTDQGAALESMTANDTTGLTQAQMQTAVMIGLVFVLVLALVMLGLEVFFVLMMKAGRNWARIVLTVLAGLSTLATLTRLTDFSAGTAVNLISTMMVIAAVVLMYRPAANTYFSQRRVHG